MWLVTILERRSNGWSDSTESLEHKLYRSAIAATEWAEDRTQGCGHLTYSLSRMEVH